MAPELSIVIPVYNQGSVLNILYREINTAVVSTPDFEIVFVDDGSVKSTKDILANLAAQDERVTVIQLDCNYGQSNAIACGLINSKGNFIVVMDADLQDNPSDIAGLYRKITEEKADMVLAARPESNGNALRNLCSRFFYCVSRLLTDIEQPPNTGVFRIISRECLNRVISEPLPPGTLLSRLYKISTATHVLPTLRSSVAAKKSGYTIRKLLRLGMERLIVHSRFPIVRKLMPSSLTDRYRPVYRIKQTIHGEKHG
jgi:glycosyltransferase involved in cell wall biosynthesis